MALQDLTPQLRTRLSRLERIVGIFVAVATLLMIAGLAYYIYQRAQTKGWGKRRLPYYTFVQNAAGLKVGQKVKLMGFEIGEVTKIEAQEPSAYYDVFVAFEVVEPYDGYLWEDSRAKVASSDLLGNRFIELSKGTNGPATYIFHPLREFKLSEAAGLPETNAFHFSGVVYGQWGTNVLARMGDRLSPDALRGLTSDGSVASVRLYDKSITTKRATGLWDHKDGGYRDANESAETRKGYFLVPDEAPALNERLETVATQVQRMVSLVEVSLPNVFDLTNQLRLVLDNTATAAASADELMTDAKPVLANLTRISEMLTEPDGSLGQWLIPPAMSLQLTQALASANTMLTNSDAQITELATGLDQTIENLANITSNLHAQVRANTNLVSEVSRLIVDTDDMVQGLKRHWLLRSAFKKKPAPLPKKTSK